MASSVNVVAFYKFVAIDDCADLQHELANLACGRGIKGTILLATEGINGTVSGSEADIATLLAHLRRDPRFADLEVKSSYFGRHPFKRLKVKVKREIVTIGAPEAVPARAVGTHVPPHDWNALMREPDVLLLDTRNAYEVEIGTFPGAVNPETSTFREFPAYVKANLDRTRHKRIAMFCTGGIRCEKASSYLLSLGFAEVYHLEGGILKYLDTIPPEQSLWQGECFVFDERVALDHGVKVGTHGLCRACGRAIKATTSGPATTNCSHCGAQTSSD